MAKTPLPLAQIAALTLFVLYGRSGTANRVEHSDAGIGPARDIRLPLGSIPSDWEDSTLVAFDHPPELLEAPPPLWPADASPSQAGLVELMIKIDAQGRVVAARAHRSTAAAVIDRAALEAVRRWRFRPARQGDVPVPAVVLIPIDFTPGE